MPKAVVGMAAAAALVLVASSAVALAKQEPAMNYEDVEGLFASVCGFCHADGGRTAGKGPQLMGTKRSDAFIINRIKQGKFGRMPAFGKELTDREIKGIVHYIRNLKPE
jgi:mono/diheme cytochrome c family protein